MNLKTNKVVKPYYESIFKGLLKITENIYKELGTGFDESVVQNAFAIEFREKKIRYLKEINIEIFYKDHYVGVDRPDFVLFPSLDNKINLNVPLVLELKSTSGSLSHDNRSQLRSYFKSLPKNRNHDIKDITLGMLIKFTKTEEFELSKDEEETFLTEVSKSKMPKEKKAIFEIELWEFNTTNEKMELLLRHPVLAKKEKKVLPSVTKTGKKKSVAKTK